ncbi:type II toxin-antitoxin system death-on-curing family toxin [soil metagenome]
MARPTVENVIFLHTVAVEAFGGSGGVRDLESLHAAVARSWNSSFGQDHFPTPFGKAAAIAESIIRRHPFVDGNKRTAMYAAAYLLETLGYELSAEQQELEDFAVSVAEDAVEFEDIVLWFERHSINL